MQLRIVATAQLLSLIGVVCSIDDVHQGDDITIKTNVNVYM